MTSFEIELFLAVTLSPYSESINMEAIWQFNVYICQFGEVINAQHVLQKRRLNQLQTLFGWNINYVDATESISSTLQQSFPFLFIFHWKNLSSFFLGESSLWLIISIFYIPGKSDEYWATQVVGPAVRIIRSFLDDDDRTENALDGEDKTVTDTVQRELWTQYICKVSHGWTEISL